MSKQALPTVEPVSPIVLPNFDEEPPPEEPPKKKKKTKEEKKALRAAKKLKKKLKELEVRYVAFRKYLNLEVKYAEFTHHMADETFEEICTFLKIPELIEDTGFENILNKINKRKKQEIKLIFKEWAIIDENPSNNIPDKGDIVRFMSV